MGEPSRYRLIKYRGGQIEEQSTGLHLVEPPAVGRRMVMYRGRSNRRIITGTVVRMFTDATAWGTYYETRNSVYLLQVEPD